MSKKNSNGVGLPTASSLVSLILRLSPMVNAGRGSGGRVAKSSSAFCSL